jgi:hypothetical protein
MRRLTGTYDGTAYVIHEYERGIVELPANLRELLVDTEGRMPLGEDLDDACRVLFGESFQAQEMD